MIPVLQIQISWVHNLMFDKNRYLSKDLRTKPKYQPHDALVLDKKIHAFRLLLAEHQKNILSLIAEFTSYPWTEHSMPIYVSDTVPNSYADPLTLKYHDDPTIMLNALIHELVHRNIPPGIHNPLSDNERESFVENITQHVTKTLAIPTESYYAKKLH